MKITDKRTKRETTLENVPYGEFFLFENRLYITLGPAGPPGEVKVILFSENVDCNGIYYMTRHEDVERANVEITIKDFS